MGGVKEEEQKLTEEKYWKKLTNDKWTDTINKHINYSSAQEMEY